MLYVIINLLFLVVWAYYVYSMTNWKKPVGWLIGNIVWLAVCAPLALFNFHYYMLIGLLSVVFCGFYDHFIDDIPFSASEFLGNAFTSLFVFPVALFERVYSWWSKNKK